jgi:hypothetical protein
MKKRTRKGERKKAGNKGNVKSTNEGKKSK